MTIPGRVWAYAGALLGGAVSIAANVAHSYVPPKGAPAGWQPHGGAVVGAVFWPAALFVAIEILARVPWPGGKRWVAVRFLGLLPVAVVAAVVSYRHLSGLLAFYAEDGLTVVIGPLAVDGLMVMATGALIATSRTRAAAAPVTEVATPPASKPAAAPLEAATPPATKPPVDPPRSRTPAARRPANGTASRVARWAAKMPDATHAEIAAKARVSVRSVERYRPATKPAAAADADPVNGVAVNLVEVNG